MSDVWLRRSVQIVRELNNVIHICSSQCVRVVCLEYIFNFNKNRVKLLLNEVVLLNSSEITFVIKL
jgi:hypothetical protein